MRDDLSERLRELTRYAAVGGAPTAWLEQTSHALVGLLLDHLELRRSLGERRLNALQERARLRRFIERCETFGYTPAETSAAARGRYGISKSTYYRCRQPAAPSRRRITDPSNDW